MRLLINVAIIFVLLPTIVVGLDCWAAATVPARFLLLLLSEQERGLELDVKLCHMYARLKSEGQVLADLAERKLTLPEAMSRVRRLRSAEEFETLLKAWRHCVPGDSADELLGRHLIQALHGWVWQAEHGVLPGTSAAQVRAAIVDLERQLDSHLEGLKKQGNARH